MTPWMTKMEKQLVVGCWSLDVGGSHSWPQAVGVASLIIEPTSCIKVPPRA